MIEIFATDHDAVVNAAVGQGKTTYRYALEHLNPLIDRLGIQRKVQDPKFYDRLKRDILNKCVMPPITIAFIESEDINFNNFDNAELGKYANDNIPQGFILDGIQRLNTLQRAAHENKDSFPYDKSLYLSVLICSSTDNLLYRMITLNNGQRPMTTRHQVEILTSNLFDFSDVDIQIATEKSNGRRRGSFKQGDFVLAYLAFLSNSTTIDNQKLIEEKLDELLAFKILETDITEPDIEFSEVLTLIERFSENEESKKWFKNVNSLIGFCSTIRKSYVAVNQYSNEQFAEIIEKFEKAFSSFSISKIRLGQARRNAVSYLISNFEQLQNFNNLELMEKIATVV
jgi:hypothetical protein